MEEWRVGLPLKNKEKGVVGKEEVAQLARKLMFLDEDENNSEEDWDI